MKISEEMLEVIKNTHKFTKEPWTSKFGISYIGYCHTLTNSEIEEGMILKLTRRSAHKLLMKDIKRIERFINTQLKSNGTPSIPQNHFDVLCSIAYDIGNVGLKNSTFFKEYKNGLLNDPASRIMVWCYIKDQLSLAMKYRREIDLQIFTISNYNITRKEENESKRTSASHVRESKIIG